MILTSIERAAVTEGRASVRPTMAGVGYLEGLTIAERQSIADAHNNLPGISETPWDQRTKAAVRQTEAKALRAVLAARPVTHCPAPISGGSPAENARSWEREVSAMLGQLGYTKSQAGAAVCWIVSRGTIDAIPVIDRQDWPAVNQIVARSTQPLPVDDHPAALDWPAWTDADVYEPTYADRVWLSSDASVDLFSPARDLADFGLMPVSGGSPAAKIRPGFRSWTPDECRVHDHREVFGPNGYDDRAEPGGRD